MSNPPRPAPVSEQSDDRDARKRQKWNGEVPSKPGVADDDSDHDDDSDSEGDSDHDDDSDDGAGTVIVASGAPATNPNASAGDRHGSIPSKGSTPPTTAVAAGAAGADTVVDPPSPEPEPSAHRTTDSADSLLALGYSTSPDDGGPGLLDGTIVALYSVLGLGTAILAARALRGRDRRLAAVRADAERISFE